MLVVCTLQFHLNSKKQLLISNNSISESVLCFSNTAALSKSDMKISKKHTILKVGDWEQLTVTFSSDKEVNDLTWSSSDENVVTVDSNGKITANNIGRSVVTASSKKENLKAVIEVEVSKEISYEISSYYRKINWNKISQVKSNLHAHTNKSDGRDTIQEVLNKHAELGYGVLAITDHDNLTLPWKETDEEIVIPKGLNLITGNEYSKNIHHLNGFFIKDIDIFTNEEKTLKHIDAQGGISHLNHPGRYDKNVDWYVDLYTKYKNLIGLEIINKDDRYPKDRRLWDDILTEIIDKRPVFGFANADSHRLYEIDTSYNMVLIDGDYSDKKFKSALKNGEFYFTARISDENDRTSKEEVPPPIITDIYVDNKSSTITIKGENIKTIEWISNNSRHIGTGETLNLHDATSPTPYVRAVIKGDGGVSFTQPFKIKAKKSHI